MSHCLIVFDLDGTLVDSRRDLADSANRMIAELGGAPLEEERIGLMVGDGAAVLVERVLAAAALDAPLGPALERFLAIYNERLLEHTAPYDGMSDVLAYAANRGARLAVLTNKPTAPSLTILERLDLARWFWRVAGGDGDFPRKPDPAGLLRLAADAGVEPPGTLLVGDSIIDASTAWRAGTRLCLARYGFGYASFFTARGDCLRGDEWAVDSPRELIGVIDKFVGEGSFGRG